MSTVPPPPPQALVVIVPLLGITYLITLVGPREPDSLASLLFIHTRSVLISFQVAKELEPCTVKAVLLCDFVLLTPSQYMLHLQEDQGMAHKYLFMIGIKKLHYLTAKEIFTIGSKSLADVNFYRIRFWGGSYMSTAFIYAKCKYIRVNLYQGGRARTDFSLAWLEAA